MTRPSEQEPSAFCGSLNGKWNVINRTCTVHSRSDGTTPSCYQACSNQFFTDDKNRPCFDFQKGSDGEYKKRYRFDDVCWAQADRFFDSCVNESSKGICSNTEAWIDAPGVFLGSDTKLVMQRTDVDAHPCRPHKDKQHCLDAKCDWKDEADAAISCSATECDDKGGDMLSDGCVVPKCRPLKPVQKAHH